MSDFELVQVHEDHKGHAEVVIRDKDAHKAYAGNLPRLDNPKTVYPPQDDIHQDITDRVLTLLNELVQLDKPAIAALIANRVPCNIQLADHPIVQVSAQHGGYHVGLLGILNGLCKTNDEGGGIIAVFNFQDKTKFNNLIGFRRVIRHHPERIFPVQQPQRENNQEK